MSRVALGFGFANARRGFTLLELIIVIGILTMLGGITFSLVMANQQSQGLQGAADLIANAIRQARNSARSSGMPVQIKLEPNYATMSSTTGALNDNTQWHITGITNEVLWSEQFEGTGNNLVAMGNELGFAGMATSSTTTGSSTSSAGWAELDVRRRIFRTEADSLYLECAIRPPLVYENGVTTESVAALALIDDAGLVLWDLYLEPQDGILNAATNQVEHSLWEAALYENNGTTPVLTDPTATNQNPLLGGRWSVFGIEYRNKNIYLYRDGKLVSSAPWTPPNLTMPLTLNWGLGESCPGAIDNIRLVRTGSADPLKLPKRITVNAPQTIVALPTGTLSGTGNIVLSFNGPRENVSATVSYNASGFVSISN